MNGRSRFRVSLGVGVVLGLGILALLNWIGSRHYARWDWTGSGLYTLSEKTRKVVKALREPVRVIVFSVPQTQSDAQVEGLVNETLKRYQALSPLLSVERIDPTRNRAQAEALVKELGLTGPAIVFRAGERKKYVYVDQLAEMDFSRARMGGGASVRSFKGEQEFTSAILSVTQPKKPKVLFTKGHGEPSIESRDRPGLWALAESLRRDDSGVEEWSGLGGGDVPAGTDLLLVAGPTTAFTEPEAEALRKFLASGGRALFLLDPALSAGRPPKILDLGLGGVLAAWGVVAGNDVVIDPKSPIPQMGAETIFATSFRPHPVTKALERSAIILPLARSVRLVEKMPEGVQGTILAETSTEGWGETDPKSLEGGAAKGDSDVPGPVPLGVAVEKGPKEGPRTRLVVLGNSGIASNGMFANAGNQIFLGAAANWALERDALVAIPPRATDQVAVTMTRQDIGRMTLVAVVAMPLLAVSLGLAVWFRRRR